MGAQGKVPRARCCGHDWGVLSWADRARHHLWPLKQRLCGLCLLRVLELGHSFLLRPVSARDYTVHRRVPFTPTARLAPARHTRCVRNSRLSGLHMVHTQHCDRWNTKAVLGAKPSTPLQKKKMYSSSHTMVDVNSATRTTAQECVTAPPALVQPPASPWPTRLPSCRHGPCRHLHDHHPDPDRHRRRDPDRRRPGQTQRRRCPLGRPRPAQT